MVASPLYRGSVLNRNGVALVDPAKLNWELARVVRALGVRIHENTPVTGLEWTRRPGLEVRTAHARVSARQVASGPARSPTSCAASGRSSSRSTTTR